MATISQDRGYSANVSLELHVQGECIPVAKVGPERIVLREARELPAGKAELSVTVGKTTTTQSIIVSPGDNPKEMRYW